MILRRTVLALCLALLAGCESSKDGPAAGVANSDWHRKDLEAHVSRWIRISPTPSGMMLAKFDRSWKPADVQGADLTTHSRVVYTMAAAYEATREPRYLEAARKGADFLLEKFRDAEFGGFMMRVDAAGKPLSTIKNTYGHAFALLALSHVARVTGEAKYKEAALAAWRDIRTNLREPSGGLRPEAPRDFKASGGNRTQNPVMHMFEALLALLDATKDPGVLADARELGDFVVYQLLVGLPSGGAYIPEWYDTNWRALPDGDGYIDLGHQFEWSHLLRSAGQRGVSPLYAEVADRILKYAVATGYDEQDGGIFNRAYANGRVDRSKFWWQQAEGMRAFLAVSQRPDMARRYRETLELVDKELLDHENGGWRFGAAKTCAGGGCGNMQPDPYHLVGMHWAALQTKQ